MKIQNTSYIIEGQDCTGKSTIISKLLAKLARREFPASYHHFMHPKGDTNEAKYAYQHGQFQLMFDMVRASLGNTRWVFDRAHIGEYVWGPKYRGLWPQYMYELEDANTDLPLVLVLIKCDPEIIVKRFKNRPNEEPPTTAEIRMLRTLFQTFCDMSPLPLYIIDTSEMTVDNYDDEIESLFEFVGSI